jgi:hypothetical protein
MLAEVMEARLEVKTVCAFHGGPSSYLSAKIESGGASRSEEGEAPSSAALKTWTTSKFRDCWWSACHNGEFSPQPS